MRAVGLPSLLVWIGALWPPQGVEPLVTNREVSPHKEPDHDTFLYLCSIDVNEQNLAVRAYREYQRMYASTTWLKGVLPYTQTLGGADHGYGVGSLDGRDQPTYWTSTKGCAYRSDFNAGDEEGPYTNYLTGVQFEFTMKTEESEELSFKVFRTLPVWDESTYGEGTRLASTSGTTTYYMFDAIHVNNNSAKLLPAACDPDAEMVDCRRSTVFPIWNDTIFAFYPG